MRSQTSDRLISYSADLHIHSALSPCAENKMTPHEVLQKIITLGIDVFSITDHNSGFNCAAFDAEAKKRDIYFIPGIELQSSEEIHLLGYFPDTRGLKAFCTAIVKPGLMQGIKNDPAQFGNQIKINSSGEIIGEEDDMLSMPLTLTIDELIERIHDFKGIAVAAHIDRGFSVVSHLGYIPREMKLDAVEIWDPTKIEKIRSTVLEGRDLNIISSSDSHYLDMMKVPKMKFWLHDPDIPNFLNCIKGSDSGRITIRKKTKRVAQRVNGSLFGSTSQVPKRDWQSVYKK